MKKLKLDLNRLTVEAFDAEAAPDRRAGTVRGNWSWRTCDDPSLCDETICQETCVRPETCTCVPDPCTAYC